MSCEVYSNYTLMDQPHSTCYDRNHVKPQIRGQSGNQVEDIENLNMTSSLDNLYYACDHNSDSSRQPEVGDIQTGGRVHSSRSDGRSILPDKKDDCSVRVVSVKSYEEIDINSLRDEDIMKASHQLRDGDELVERQQCGYGEMYTRESPYSAETVSTPDTSGPYNENYHHIRDESLGHSPYSDHGSDANMNVQHKKNNRSSVEDLGQNKQSRIYDSITTQTTDRRTFGVGRSQVDPRMCVRDQYNEHVTDETDCYRHRQHAEELRPLSDIDVSARDQSSYENRPLERHNSSERVSSGHRTHERINKMEGMGDTTYSVCRDHGRLNSVEGNSESSRSSLPSSGDVKMSSSHVSGEQLSDRSPESMDLSLSTPRDSSPEKISPLVPIHQHGDLIVGSEHHPRNGRETSRMETRDSESQKDERDLYNFNHHPVPDVTPSSRKTNSNEEMKRDERIWSSSSFSIHGDVYEEGMGNLRRPTARMVRSYPLSRQASLDFGDAEENLFRSQRQSEVRTIPDSQKDGGDYGCSYRTKAIGEPSQADLEVQYISRSRHSSGASPTASPREFGPKKRTVSVPNFLQQQYLDSGICSEVGSPMESRIHDNDQMSLDCSHRSRHSSESSRRSSGREKGHGDLRGHGSSGLHGQQNISGSVGSVNRKQIDPLTNPSQMGSERQVRAGDQLKNMQQFGSVRRVSRMNRVDSLPIIYQDTQQQRHCGRSRRNAEEMRRYYREKRSKSEDALWHTQNTSLSRGFRPIESGERPCQKINLQREMKQDYRRMKTSGLDEDHGSVHCTDREPCSSTNQNASCTIHDKNTEISPMCTSQPSHEGHNYRNDESLPLNVQTDKGMRTMSKLNQRYVDDGLAPISDKNDEKQEVLNVRPSNNAALDGLHKISNKQNNEMSRSGSRKEEKLTMSEEIPDRQTQNRCDMSSGRIEKRKASDDRYETSDEDRKHRNQKGVQENMHHTTAKPRAGQDKNETGTEYIDQCRREISNNSSDFSEETVLQKSQSSETGKTGSSGKDNFSPESVRHLTRDKMSQQEAMIDQNNMRQQLPDTDERLATPEHFECRTDRYMPYGYQHNARPGQVAWDARQETDGVRERRKEIVNERDVGQSQVCNRNESQRRTTQREPETWDVSHGRDRNEERGQHVTRKSVSERDSGHHQGHSRYRYQRDGPVQGQQQQWSDAMDAMERYKSHSSDDFYDDDPGGEPLGSAIDRVYEVRKQVQGHMGGRHREDVNSMMHVDVHNVHGHVDRHGSRHTVKADVHASTSPVAPYRRGQYAQMSSMHGHSKYKQKPKYPYSWIQHDSPVPSKDYMEGSDSLYPMREQHGIQGAHDIAVLISPEFIQSTGSVRAPVARPEQNHATRHQTSIADGPVSLQDPADMNSQDGGGQSEAKTASSSSQMHSSSTSHSQASHASHASANHSHSAAANESQAQAQSQVNGTVVEDRKNLKNLPLEEVLGRTKAIVAELGKLEDYHRGEGMRLQKMLGDFYWDYTSQRQQIGDAIAEAGYAEITIKMLKNLNTTGIFKNDDVWFPAYYTYNTTWNYSDSSHVLARSLAEADAVRLLTLNCSHKPYLTNIHSKNVYYVMKASMSILHNIARNPNVKSYFKENKTAEVIMPFINMNDDMLRVLAMLTLAYIVEEEDNSKLIDETGTIKNVVMWIGKALDNPKRRFKGFTPQELTQGLDKLAVNDGNKPKIIEEGSIPLFMKMLQSDNDKEQSTTARCVWTLSFDKDVRKQFMETDDMLSTLEKLTESQVKEVKKNARGALWVLNGKGDAPTDRPRSAPRGKNHIFISYSWNEQEQVLEIRDRLRAEGYVVWVDVDQMGGSTLQAMAEAVENAAVVLVCMSEKYKQSPNCRTEAEYTFQLRKDYIPLMMQKKYRPDGWLGMILGAKLFFDFSGKYPFEKSASGLLKELRGRGKRSNVMQSQGQGSDEVDTLQATADNQLVHAGNPHRNTHPSTELALPQGHQPQACLMSRDDVQRWLIAHQLDGSIAAFSQFDGRLLWQLREMKQEAPDFFYQCIEKKLNMNLIDMLRLASALETLH